MCIEEVLYVLTVLLPYFMAYFMAIWGYTLIVKIGYGYAGEGV